MKQIDFVERLNFLLETLYYDALDGKNRIIFEYDPSYPRVFAIDSNNVLKTMEWIAKAYLLGTSEANININFKLTNYNADTVFFSVFFSVDKDVKLDELSIQKANKFAATAKAKILITNNNQIVLYTSATLDREIKSKNISLKSNVIKSYYAIAAYEDNLGFEILRNILKVIGVKIGSKSDFVTFKKHIKDSIYMPSVVFVSMDYFKTEQDLDELLEIQKLKGYGIVVVCHKQSKFEAKFKEHAIILREPYTYDAIVAALNYCYTKSLKR
ncbi:MULTISPECIES: hypothetical protein [unclassified Campylobacter]|uniref:hypothetical protein n=1 Tax=unclassified Campylobacter TaxID=2593542 RepID=UPI003D3500AE